eukprot:1758479-Pleurochrysis_carterae.AAC.1
MQAAALRRRNAVDAPLQRERAAGRAGCASERLLVDDVREAHVEDDAVVDGDAEQNADELKLALVL